MTLHQIKHRYSGKVLFLLECRSLKLCLEAAVKAKINLDGADLAGSNLDGAFLNDARLYGASLVGASLVGASLVGARLYGADLVGANLDFSAWPLWCGSLKAKVDKRIARQLLYHTIVVSRDHFDWPQALIDEANKFHRVGEVPAIARAEGGK